MDRLDFLNLITNGFSNPIIAIIKARGFLIDIDSDDYFLSDNGTKNDVMYLSRLLSENNLGRVIQVKAICKEKDNKLAKIELKNGIQIDRVFDIFFNDEEISMESSYRRYSIDCFMRRRFGEKCDVEILEPFVARYIKAISACGVLTDFSCDANHKNSSEIAIGCCQWFDLYHDWIYRNVLPIEYQSDNYTTNRIHICEDSRYFEYYKLNKAADFLYLNRILLRKLKSEMSLFIRNNYVRKIYENNFESYLEKTLNYLYLEEKYNERIQRPKLY